LITVLFFSLVEAATKFYVAPDWAQHKSHCACSSTLCFQPFWFI